MAAAIVKKYNLSAKGILVIDDDVIGIENEETGELIALQDLLSDFKDKTVKLEISYDEEYGANEE